MKILILWAPLADYTIACFRQLALKEDVEILLVCQSSSSEAPFNDFDSSFTNEYIEDAGISVEYLTKKALDFNPDVILMASWNYSHYMDIAKKCKKNGTVVISAFDNQWKNTLKQNLASFLSPIYLKPIIDNFLVPGDRQAQFANKLGYRQPIYGFYCANSDNLKEATFNSENRKFLFIGRLIEQKGVRILIEAYKKYRENVTNPWELCIAGKGTLEDLFRNQDGIILKSFVQPNQLSDLFSEASCFVLPSLHENWGLVIHEAALAGLPIISSSNCGASTWFLRDGQNGCSIDPNVDSLSKAFISMHNKNSLELKKMSDNSKTLGNLWQLEDWANYLYGKFNDTINNKATLQ